MELASVIVLAKASGLYGMDSGFGVPVGVVVLVLLVVKFLKSNSPSSSDSNGPTSLPGQRDTLSKVVYPARYYTNLKKPIAPTSRVIPATKEEIALARAKERMGLDRQGSRSVASATEHPVSQSLSAADSERLLAEHRGKAEKILSVLRRMEISASFREFRLGRVITTYRFNVLARLDRGRVADLKNTMVNELEALYVQPITTNDYPVLSVSMRNNLSAPGTEAEDAAMRRTEEDEVRNEFIFDGLDVLKHTGRATTGTFQRLMGIGYVRASELLVMMEEKGIVGPDDGSGKREILVDLKLL